MIFPPIIPREAWTGDPTGPGEIERRQRELACPEGLSPLGRMAWQIIVELLIKHDLTFTGGCHVFHVPGDWKNRGEAYCGDSELVVVYDGAEAKYLCSLDGLRYDINNELQKALEAVGLFYEEGTHWYGGIYKRSAYFDEMRQIRGLIKYAPQEELANSMLAIVDQMYAKQSETPGRAIMYDAGREVSGADLVDLVSDELMTNGWAPQFNSDFDDEPAN